MSERTSGADAKPRPLVLLVEDDAQTSELYALTLMDGGYRVAQAQNGLSAVEKASTLVPDVIVLDLILPGLAGEDVCRRLRAESRTRRIPIVVVTGDARRVSTAREAGAVSVLVKPCPPELLKSELARVLRLARSTGRRSTLLRARARALLEGTRHAPDAEYGKASHLRCPSCRMDRVMEELRRDHLVRTCRCPACGHVWETRSPAA